MIYVLYYLMLLIVGLMMLLLRHLHVTYIENVLLFFLMERHFCLNFSVLCIQERSILMGTAVD